MADKTPVRVVFNESNVATGMAEFQSGDTVPVANGGTGLTAIGSAGQVLKVNGTGNGLEFGAEGDISITNLVAPTNADLTLTTSGTGNIVLDAVTVRGTTFSAADSTKITFAESVDVTGTLTSSGLSYPTSDGTGGQFLKTDGSGTLSFADLSLGDLTIIGSTISAPSNADLSLQPGGTGDVLLSALRINGTTLDSADSTKITIAEAVDVTGALVAATSINIAGDGATVTGIKDEDDMSSNSATKLATQQSIKAYVDSSILTKDNTDEIAEGSTNLYFTNARADARITAALIDEDNMASNSATRLPSQQSVKAYIDAQNVAQALTFVGDDSTGTAVNSGETFQIAGGTGLTSAVVNDTMTLAIDSTVATLTGSQTLTNKTLTTATIGDFTISSSTIARDGGSMNITSGSSLTVDVDGAIILDAGSGGGGIQVKDDGTEIIRISNSSSDVSIETKVQDKDLLFKGNDGGSSITAFTLDMSEAGAATFNDKIILGANKEIQFVDTNESIKSDGSKMIIKSGGTTFNLPTADGNAGDVLKTDGAGTLSFASSTATASDDTRAVTKNNKSVSTSARTVDYFQKSSADMAWYFVAINDLTNDRSSASCFTVVHNDTNSFVSGPRGGSSASANSLPSTTADMSSNQVRVKITAPSDDSKISYYKIPISRANTANETAGVTITTANTDVDSSSEVIDSFAHGTHRAAKYTILIDNDAKTETGVIEALVVHDGSTAFISQYGLVNTGSNDMITLTAQLVSNDVVVSAAGLEPNLSLKIHKTLLSDSMSAVSNANQKIIGATTVSSSATAFDNFDLDDATAAMYYVVGGNSSEGHFSVYEVFCAGAPGEASVTPGSYVSTKGTSQLQFTAGFKSDADNSLELSVSSTSGGSTVVNAYRINCLAE